MTEIVHQPATVEIVRSPNQEVAPRAKTVVVAVQPVEQSLELTTWYSNRGTRNGLLVAASLAMTAVLLFVALIASAVVDVLLAVALVACLLLCGAIVVAAATTGGRL